MEPPPLKEVRDFAPTRTTPVVNTLLRSGGFTHFGRSTVNNWRGDHAVRAFLSAEVELRILLDTDAR